MVYMVTNWPWIQERHLYLPLSDHRTQGEFFRHFLIQKSIWLRHTGWTRGAGDTGAGRVHELRPGQRRMHGHLLLFVTSSSNFPQPYIPSLPRKAAPSKLVLPIWLWKGPQKRWLQQPQLTISTFVLSCLFAAKTAAQRESDFWSLLLKSHSATFAHG